MRYVILEAITAILPVTGANYLSVFMDGTTADSGAGLPGHRNFGGLTGGAE